MKKSRGMTEIYNTNTLEILFTLLSLRDGERQAAANDKSFSPILKTIYDVTLSKLTSAKIIQ